MPGPWDLPALAIALVVSTWIVLTGDRLWFFFDEWSWIQERALDIDSLVRPHNGHLVAIPAFLFMGTLELFGTGSYLPFLLLSVIAHCVTALLAYLIVARRAGRWVGTTALVGVLLLGSGWMNIVWGFQVQMILPVAFALAGIAVLDRKPGADAVAACLVAGAVASQGAGLPVLVGFWVHAVVMRAWRRLAMLSGVFCLYCAWLVAYGDPQGSPKNIGVMARYVYDSAAYTAAAVGGRERWFAIVVLAVLCVVALRRGRAFFTAPETVVPTVAMVSGWVLTGYARGDMYQPDASRYLYVSAVYLLVTILVCAPRPSTPPRSLLFLPVTLLLVQPNVHLLRDGIWNLENVTDIVRADLAVIEAVGDIGRDGYRPNLNFAPQIFAGPHLAAVERYGPMGFDIEDAAGFAGALRQDMDRVAFEYLGVAIQGAVDGVADTDDSTDGGAGGSCIWTTAEPGEWNDLAAEWVVVRHRRPVTLSLRMFSDSPSATAVIALDGSGSSLLRAPTHPALPIWRISANKRADIAVCRTWEGTPRK